MAALFSRMPQDLVFHRDLQVFFCQGRAGQTESLSDTTSKACLADGHQPQGPPPFFPGERPPGGDPAFLAPGKRDWPPTSYGSNVCGVSCKRVHDPSLSVRSNSRCNCSRSGR